MRSSQWPGPLLATSLPLAAEIRVCGSGKVSLDPSRCSREPVNRHLPLCPIGSARGLLSFSLPQLMKKTSMNVSVSSTLIHRMSSMWFGTQARR